MYVQLLKNNDVEGKAEQAELLLSIVHCLF